jgi:multimeric flavodoxin WrbA
MQKVLVVMGSPRRKGNSTTLAENVIAGAKNAGAEVESFHLHEMDIKPCDACDACRKEASSRGCIIDDDMQDIYPKLLEADALVIASPIYWFTVSAQTKLFMDRWYAFGNLDGYGLKGKRIGILLTYGDTDPFNSGAVDAIRTFQDAFSYVGAHIVGMVYGSAEKAGEISNNGVLMDKAYQLGEQLAT